MHILVASSKTSVPRPDDFSYTVDGELVWFGPTCDCPDCGCDRAAAGLASSKGTTMFRVIDHPSMTRSEYRKAFREGLQRQGWFNPANVDDVAEIDAFADAHLDDAAQFRDGTELRLVNGELRPRQPRAVR